MRSQGSAAGCAADLRKRARAWYIADGRMLRTRSVLLRSSRFVPVGSVLAVVPPSLFALVQFPQSSKALLVIGGLAAVQIILGNYVDPRIQGRWLSLSPFVVLLSVAFWGWLWGPAGALIAVPITLAMVVAGKEFPSLRPLSVLLAEEEKDKSAAPTG